MWVRLGGLGGQMTKRTELRNFSSHRQVKGAKAPPQPQLLPLCTHVPVPKRDCQLSLYAFSLVSHLLPDKLSCTALCHIFQNAFEGNFRNGKVVGKVHEHA